MNRTLAGLVGGVPELIAGALTAACILTPYYALQPERTPTTMTVEQPRYDVSAEVLQIEVRPDGELYVKTMPLPEYIAVDAGLWDSAEPYDPTALPEDHETLPGPPTLWLEKVTNGAVGQTDVDGNPVAPDARHDYVLHIDASNVTASYKLLTEDADGTRLMQLHSWGER